MKKLAVLVLVTFLVGASAFAIDGIGDFTAGLEIGIDDITDADGDEGMTISAEPSIAFSRAFSDAFSLTVKLGDVFKYWTGDIPSSSDAEPTYDELYLAITPAYNLAAGPGTLGLSLTLKPVFVLMNFGDDNPDPKFVIDPTVSYTLPLDFGTLGFALGTDSMGIEDGKNEKGDGYGLVVDDAYFKASVSLPMGLSFWVSPRLYMGLNDAQGDTELSEIRADVTYTLSEMVNFGVEVRVPLGSEDGQGGIKENGLFVKPHVNLAFGAIKPYLAVELSKLGDDAPQEVDPTKDTGIGVKAIIGATYSF
jgi:hypothetical protein